MKRIALILASGLFASVALLPSADSAPAPISERRVTELQQLHFGMFVCWSFSTFSGREWTPGVTNMRHRAVGEDRQGRAHGLHPVSDETSRRFLPVGHEDHRAQSHEGAAGPGRAGAI